MSINIPSKMHVNWDYSEHAEFYDKRADYSEKAIAELIKMTGCIPQTPIADIGAGTGKLTKELLKCGLTVKSIEPNEAMRSFGIKNTKGKPVTWLIGSGEATGLPASSVYAAFFGSSFNVVDQVKTLNEVCRILVPKGWFGCMWNHRNLNDPIQQIIESIIKSYIPNYSYGLRRENPTTIIAESQNFSDVKTIESDFSWQMAKDDIVTAWRSHATLRRQAESDGKFKKIISDIEKFIDTLSVPVSVPYTTRIFFAQMINTRIR